MQVKRKGNKNGYYVIDKDCIGRFCFQPGQYQHRAATSSGSRATGAYSFTCMHNAYHGCPSPLPEPSDELKKQRKAEGWKA